jgi:hypothetical protein
MEDLSEILPHGWAAAPWMRDPAKRAMMCAMKPVDSVRKVHLLKARDAQTMVLVDACLAEGRGDSSGLFAGARFTARVGSAGIG